MMIITTKNNIEIDKFVKSLKRPEFDTYTEKEIKAFCDGVSRALDSLGVDYFTVSDFREWFQNMYFKYE